MTAPTIDPSNEALKFLAGGGEMGQVIAGIDWSNTGLGPIESWPPGLRTTVSLALASTFPISIAWGSDHEQIYNDSYRVICGAKHPGSMGQDFRKCWASAFPVIGAAYEKAWRGQGSYLENQRMFLDRFGYLEETFFTFSFSPIRDETGKVAGIMNPCTETTAQMLSERRTRALRDLGASTANAKSIEEACALAVNTLAGYNLDLPFVLAYVATPSGRWELVAATGLDEGSCAKPKVLADGVDDAASWPIGSVISSGRPVHVDDLERRFGGLSPGSDSPYPESPRSAFLLPLRPAGVERPLGVLVAAVSTRRPLDEQYRGFFDMLGSAVTSAVANARAYEEERKRAEALAALDRAKIVFFSNVSHEFRTPLTLMLGPQEDALGSPEGVLAGEQLQAVHRNTLRLLKLVNSLLDFSRIEARRAEPSYEPLDLAALTRDLASAFRSAVENGGLRFDVHCPTLPEPIYVDRDMWEKVVLNLLSNAFKFTFEGSITVTLRVVRDHVALSVADTGIGIPPHELPRVFERFHRIEGARSRTYEGTGIGLALVHDLAHLLGGTVEVTSTVGVGTTFTVSIPLGNAHLPAERIGAARTVMSTAVSAETFVQEAMRWLPHPSDAVVRDEVVAGHGWPRTGNPSALRVLVADDNADIRDYIARLLRPHWQVQTVMDGAQALARALEAPPDLVVADVMMPTMDGFGLLRALRDDPRTARIPVIMVSARAGEESRLEGLATGADDYLVKPFSARELIARVHVHLASVELRRAAEAERDRLRSLLSQVPAVVNFLRGPELVFEFAHPLAIQAFDGRALLNKPLLEAVPEFCDQQYPGELRRVLDTGEPIEGRERLARLADQTGNLRDT